MIMLCRITVSTIIMFLNESAFNIFKSCAQYENMPEESRMPAPHIYERIPEFLKIVSCCCRMEQKSY